MFVGGHCPGLETLLKRKPVRKGTTSSQEHLLAHVREIVGSRDPDEAVYRAGRRIFHGSPRRGIKDGLNAPRPRRSDRIAASTRRPRGVGATL